MGQTSISHLHVELTNGITLEGDEIYWQNLDWDELKNSNALVMDSAGIGNLNIVNIMKPR